MNALPPCSFRAPAPGADGNGAAVCGLISTLLGTADGALCTVRPDACEACHRDDRPTADQINPVVASLLFAAASRFAERAAAEGRDPRDAIALRRWAKDNLLGWPAATSVPGGVRISAPPSEYLARGRTYACDVVLCCEDSSNRTKRAVQSVLGQDAAAVALHLVDNGGGGRGILEHFANHGEVYVYREPRRRSPLAILHDLAPRLRTPVVAIQDPRTISRPYRIAYSVGLLEDHGAEILAARLRTPGKDIEPEPVQPPYRRFLPAATLVLRRDSLLDMGGAADCEGNDAELVWRAYHEGRSILLAGEVTAEADAPFYDPPSGPAPRYEFREGGLRHHARGFPLQRVACDVVLPFIHRLEYVRECIESVLEQEDAEVVLHLIDDGGLEDSGALLRAFAGHPQVRLYRNMRNLGQFTSFNNVTDYLETGLVAVQDSDDISLPHRLHWAGNLLCLAGAGIFGSAVRTFETHLQGGDPSRGVPPRPVRRCSRIAVPPLPRPGLLWFLQNPTAVIRADVFRALGGFADFGDPVRNRCTLDNEFYVRAWWAGTRMAFSRRPTVLYRQHPGQTTKNSVTGWGTPMQDWSNAECARRGEIYRTTRFDPAVFGALDKYRGLTQRLRPGDLAGL